MLFFNIKATLSSLNIFSFSKISTSILIYTTQWSNTCSKVHSLGGPSYTMITAVGEFHTQTLLNN